MPAACQGPPPLPHPTSPPVKPLFPQLRGGAGGLPPVRVAEHQKRRLEGAMVEAVARHGFAATTLSELVGLAGVSKTTFYQHFDNKLDCFLATFDAIVREVAARMGEAGRGSGDPRERLFRALTVFIDLVVEEPAAAGLVTVESLTLGAAGVAHREPGAEAFELMVRQSFDHSPSSTEVSDVVVRGIVAGIRGIVYRHLRDDKVAELPASVEWLVDWALSYQEEPEVGERQAIEAARRSPTRKPEHEPRENSEDTLPWEEPADSPRSRSRLTQRERMARAAAQVVVARGYAALSIPAISAAAGTSNQTFYEHFDSKRDAFLAAFEAVAADVLGVVGGAFLAEGGRPEAVGVAIRTLLEYFAERELFSQLAFFELPSAGPVALDRADRALDDFTAFLMPGLAPVALGGPLPEETLPAISSGIWAVVQHEIAAGRRESLPALAPEITRLAVGPFNRGG
ncbi:MAG TPA: TetR/AcrR family transcriptional regulator [Solirubrobacterales bacterium]|jgi:AcrR family transcriptional regulator|nr:TetR/AcrR family transcriptional regulator [Solirubrobacterales bacterium]